MISMVGSIIFNVPLDKCGYVTITSKLLEHVGLCRRFCLNGVPAAVTGGFGFYGLR